jgi:nicotinamidase-related amidase
MILPEREDFIRKSASTLGNIYDHINTLKDLPLNCLDPGKTALVMVDVINGFTREGTLKSARMEALIPVIAGLSEECAKRGIARIAFADSHAEKSPEFDSYPVHCLAGTPESEVVDELKKHPGYLLIQKNSTNGLLENGFQDWLERNGRIRNFIVVGGCTDICVLQFALSLKTWFNIRNEKSRIIVPIDAVDTYDSPQHDGDLLNAVSLHIMEGSGIEPVKTVTL